MAKRKCVVCGKEFNLSPSHEVRGKTLGQTVGTYCSRECQHNGKSVLCRCKQCFGVYEVSLYKALSGDYSCCSNRCSTLYQREAKGWMPKVVCAFCGKEFQRNSNHVNKDGDNFCSPKCSAEASRKYFPKPCEYCGKEFTPDYEGKRFCSRKCQSKAASAPVVQHRCKNCGKRFRFKEYLSRSFCSINCYSEHREFNRSGRKFARVSPGRRNSGNGYIYEHVVIMEAYLGRRLEFYSRGHGDNEVVHHIDRNKKNNKIWNLELCIARVHTGYHANHVFRRKPIKE